MDVNGEVKFFLGGGGSGQWGGGVRLGGGGSGWMGKEN